MSLTIARLYEVLDYDPITGAFRWIRRQPAGRPSQGGIAGTLTSRGYREIFIDRKKYRASRLAWFYMTGNWPDEEIDHKNRVKDDDRWENLRGATSSQNKANTALTSRNTSGVKGVSWYRDPRWNYGSWTACIRRNGKTVHLGYFDTIEEAGTAYAKAAKEIYGEFRDGHKS